MQSVLSSLYLGTFNVSNLPPLHHQPPTSVPPCIINPNIRIPVSVHISRRMLSAAYQAIRLPLSLMSSVNQYPSIYLGGCHPPHHCSISPLSHYPPHIKPSAAFFFPSIDTIRQRLSPPISSSSP